MDEGIAGGAETRHGAAAGSTGSLPEGPAGASLPEPEAWGRLLRSLRHWLRIVGRSSPGARAVELDGVTASVAAAAPERGFLNSVVYDRPEQLVAALPELAAAYDAAAIEAWCVWVPPGGREAGASLERFGHVLDSIPQAMTRELDGIERPAPGVLEEWTADGDTAVMAAVNDASFGFGTDSFARGLSTLPDEVHTYVASMGGKPVATVLATDHEGNCEIDGVATLPEARGRGFSGALLGHALADAAERGVETTTLVATRLGQPVYERLGYRGIGTIEMWEMRPPR